MDIETPLQANEMLIAAMIAALNSIDPRCKVAMYHALDEIGATLADGFPQPQQQASLAAVRLARNIVSQLIGPSD
jgi:hypothetical protein